MERLDTFMARASAAYYATCDPFADFATSPEISQVFGELLGAWAAVVWDRMGRPSPVILAECGPGRGTLMSDALRLVGRLAPELGAALRLHLVETSPRLRAAQAAALPGATWHDDAATLPAGPLILIANEFLDALPVRQFVRRAAGWTERFVADGRFVEAAVAELPDDLPPLHPAPGGEGRGEGGADREGPSSSVQPCAHPHPGPLPRAGEGAAAAVVELREPARALAALLAARFAVTPGAALFLDYGPARSGPGDSLQALRDGRPADPLVDPGSADLTAHVDFADFARAARGAAVHGPVPQGRFLAALGLFQRTDRLAQTLPPLRALALTDSARRLAEPDRMGQLFKALALCSPGQPAPPGFEP